MKKQGFAAIAVALLLLLTACSAATSNESYDSSMPEMPQFNGTAGMEDNKAEAMPEDMPSEDMTIGDGGSMAELPDGTERKLIKNADYRLETLEYDKTIQMIQELTQIPQAAAFKFRSVYAVAAHHHHIAGFQQIPPTFHNVSPAAGQQQNHLVKLMIMMLHIGPLGVPQVE